ncbi:MAG: peroxiredoxin-like family protein [Methyloceanibacter sp.]
MSSKSFAEILDEAFEQCSRMDASLNQRLQAFADTVRKLNPTFAEGVDRLVARLHQAGAGTAAPAPGDEMPNFLLPDDTGHLVSLEEILQKGPVALAFHRGHWCPYCRINTNALVEAQSKAQAEGSQIAAILPERRQFASELRAEAKAPFPILLDMDNGYAMSLNLAICVGEEMKRMMAESGWDLPAYQGNDAWMLPIPATFIVATDGRITARFVDPDYRKRMAIEDMLDALKAAH